MTPDLGLTPPTATRQRLIDSAIDLFAANWYMAVSVANICRQAGLSNGIFYKYFKDKDSLLKEILDQVIGAIADRLGQGGGDKLRERIHHLVDRLLDYAREHPNLIKVYREGQYRFYDYEQKLTSCYEQALLRLLGGPGRQIDHAAYLFALGGLRFVSVQAALNARPASRVALYRILEHGIFSDQSCDEKKIFDITINPLPIEPDDGTEKRLLEAAKRLFGSQGFYQVNIHDITSAANVAVGTFYKYFASKESCLERLIDEAGHDIRRFIAANLSAGLNRLERELQGLYLFTTYLSIDQWCYNLVREGEFIVPQQVKEYYRKFGDAYRRNPAQAIPQPAVAASDQTEPSATPDPAAYADTAIGFLLGIAHYLGIEKVFDPAGRNIRQLIKGLARYLTQGLTAPATPLHPDHGGPHGQG